MTRMTTDKHHQPIYKTMKRILIVCMIAASCIMGQQAKAQSFLESILSGIASGNTSGSDALGAVLNGAVTSTTSNTKGSNVGNVLGNIISSVTGSATTTQANLVGTWSYNEPAVQFESKNLLTKAGGAAAATKVENKLASFYNMMGIRTGRVSFTFDKDGGVVYNLSLQPRLTLLQGHLHLRPEEQDRNDDHTHRPKCKSIRYRQRQQYESLLRQHQGSQPLHHHQQKLQLNHQRSRWQLRWNEDRIQVRQEISLSLDYLDYLESLEHLDNLEHLDSTNKKALKKFLFRAFY